MWQTWRNVNSPQSHLSSPPPHRQSYQGAGVPASSLLTRGRRGGRNKSKSTHSWGILGDQLLAIRAYLALFVLEQTRETSVGGAQACSPQLADGQMHRTCWQCFPSSGQAQSSGAATPPWRKRGRTPAPAKTLRTCQSRIQSKGSSPSFHAGQGRGPLPQATPHTSHKLLSVATNVGPERKQR